MTSERDLTVEMPIGAAQGELDRLTAAVDSGTVDPAGAFSSLALVCEGLMAEAGRHLVRVGQLTVALDEVVAVAEEAIGRVTDEMVDDLEDTLRRVKSEGASRG